MNKLKYLLALCLILPGASVRAENKYLAADLMFLDMQLTANNASSDATPAAIEVRLGSLIQEYFAVEGAFAFGVTDDSFNSAATGKLKTLFAVNAVGRLPVGESAEVYGRVGLAKMDVKISGSGTAAGSHNDTGILYGIGVAIDISRYSALGLEYTQLPDVDVSGGNKVETSSINISYRVLF
jgi:opacity protein-like surface antigen